MFANGNGDHHYHHMQAKGGFIIIIIINSAFIPTVYWPCRWWSNWWWFRGAAIVNQPIRYLFHPATRKKYVFFLKTIVRAFGWSPPNSWSTASFPPSWGWHCLWRICCPAETARAHDFLGNFLPLFWDWVVELFSEGIWYISYNLMKIMRYLLKIIVHTWPLSVARLSFEHMITLS